jgi:hypothetical protein
MIILTNNEIANTSGIATGILRIYDPAHAPDK